MVCYGIFDETQSHGKWLPGRQKERAGFAVCVELGQNRLF
jgi:hypothetical protein